MISKEMIQEVHEYAKKHYSDGWDVVVECYDDDEIIRAIEIHERFSNEIVTTANRAIEIIGEIVDLHVEQQEEAWGAGGLCTKCGSPDHERKDCPNER